MSRLRVVPIVEGHGEVEAVRLLLSRIWTDVLPGEYVEVLAPIRQPRNRLVQKEYLERAVQLAKLKLRSGGSEEVPGLILLLLDADKDRPCELGPRLQGLVADASGDVDVTCVIANVEYETWFVAAASSLTDYLDLSRGGLPGDPEGDRCGKGWVGSRIKSPKYSETIDQPALTARMDLRLCRERSPSFDKLCRELEKRLQPKVNP